MKWDISGFFKTKRRTVLKFVGLLLLVLTGCGSVVTHPAEQPVSIATEPPAAPATQVPTATREALETAEWATYTNQQCKYSLSYPSEMQLNRENPYSRTLGFNLADPDVGARNFIYVSVVAPEIQSLVEQGVYDNEIYNYAPAEAEILLSMQVGEKVPVRQVPNAAQGFTYQRMQDTILSGYAAQTYENVQPWEFPGGTKEIRYYLSHNGCIYLIGGYLDTTGSNQPGAITEDLFHQIIATLQLVP